MTDWAEHTNIIAGGGLAVVLVGLFMRHMLESAKRQQKWSQRVIENHISHNTKMLGKMVQAMQDIATALRRRD